MKNNIEHIEFINKYINNQLSEADRAVFESNLKTDSAFNELYEEQLTFIEGLKRTQLIAEMNAAKSNYIKIKWLKQLVLPILVVGLSIVCYNLFFGSKIETEEAVFSNEVISVIATDSVAKKYTVIHKKDTIINDVWKTEAYGVNAFKEVTLTKYSGLLTLKEFEQMFPDWSHLRPINDSILVHKKVDYSDKVEDHAIVGQSSKTKSIGKKAFHDSIKKTPQVIVVNTERDTTIICKEGTKLTIKAKSFIDGNTKKPISGDIKLKVTEYYKLSDMLLANLSTKSDDKILETGGMLHIEADQNGNTLKLKADKKIGIAFPKKKNKKGMQLFSGDKNQHGINWNLQEGKEKAASTIVNIPSEGTEEVAFNRVENVPVFPGCEMGDNYQKKKCLNEKIKRFVTKEFNTNIAEELKLKGKHKIRVFFKVDTNGDIVDAEARAAHQELAEEAIRIVDLLPKMKPATQRGTKVIVSYYFPIRFTSGGSTNNRVFKNNASARSNKAFTERFKKRVDNLGVQNVDSRDITRYAFSSSSLGWINCDRFIEMGPERMFKLQIDDYVDTDVNLIFKSMNTILPSRNKLNDYDFGVVPSREEDIVLVAIKRSDNALYLGIKERNTKNESRVNFDYKKVSVHELKEELSELDTLFDSDLN